MSDPASVSTLPELIRLDRPVLLVGRGGTADVRLPHPGVSRRHAELRADAGGISVHDVGGRGGVVVNGAAVATARLNEDDVVAFGPIAYEVKGGHLRRVLQTRGVTLEARGLTIDRGGRTILSNVNLTIPANNFVGILGPSGAGKTTLLKGLTGFLPAAGQVCFDGLDLASHREACRLMVGFVPQEEIVYGSLTARENLDYALRLRVAGDLRASERAVWVEQTLKRLSLEAHADRPVRTLSGGQRKRVSVAIELLARPGLLLLDEPTSGLDPAAEARLMHFLHDLSRRGTTVICTTHVLESLNLFDAVLVVAGGQLLGSGSPQKLLGHFQAQTYAELYEKLETPPPTPQTRTPLAFPSPTGLVPSRTSHSRPGTLRQVAIQFQRGLLLIARDPALLALLIGQPLLIGFLITLSQANPGETKKLDLLCTFAVVAGIWLGLNNTAREVIRDRAVYVRERRGTVNPESYLLAKVALFGLIGFGQIVLMVLWLRYCNFIPRTHDAYRALLQLSLVKFILVLWLTYCSAMLLGLLISTLAPSEEVAVAALPLVVLPQLLFSGAATEFVRLRIGSFNALPIMLEMASKTERPWADWGLELASLFTYSRPALVFFLNYRDPATRVDPTLVTVVNWAHLLVLLLATATAFVAVFLKRERRWLENA